MHFDHIKDLARIFRYQSPRGRVHRPRRIHAGLEEVEVIVKGRGAFRECGRPIDAGPGSMLWYYEGDCVEVTSDKEFPYDVVVFEYEVSGLPVDKRPMHSEWIERGACRRFCLEALADFSLTTMPSPRFPVCVYSRLFWEATQYHRLRREARLPVSIRAATAYLSRRFTEDISVPDIASAAGTSVSHLHLLFRTHLHTSPLQYLMRYRLARARELLTTTHLSIKETCFASGFRDVKNFCVFFKRHSGMTPTQYRNRASFV